MKLLGIEFAPVKVPLERRLQTLAVLHWVFCFIFLPGVCVAVLVTMLFVPPLSVFALLYIAFMVYDHSTPARGGRRMHMVRNAVVWRYFRDYFPIHMVKTADLDPRFNYIFGYHPHGILGCGAFCNFATEATNFSTQFPGITPRLLTLKSNFYWPVLRAYTMACGLCDVGKESIRWLLTKEGVGNAIVIVIGGAEEALLANPQNYEVKLLNRKGFIRLALEHGAHLVPVFSFGENDLFIQAKNPTGSRLRRFQECFKQLFGFSPPLFHGRGIFQYTFGILPFRRPVHTVIGRPIVVDATPSPSGDAVDDVHKRYMDALSQLFDEHKTRFGVPRDTHLTFT